MPKNTVSKTSKKLFSTSTLVTLSLLTALSIILERFLGFMPTPNIRIAFGNLPIILAGLLFGPVAGGIVALLSDILGTTLFSSFPWFAPMALTPVIMGVVPPIIGRFMRKRTSIVTFIALILPAEILGPIVWSNVSLQMLNGVPFMVNFPLRAPVKLLIAVVDILLVFLLYKSGVFRALGLDKFGGKSSELRGNAKVHSQR
ncbi:MAG TPA: folate family ECF transporter S component [Papillibacter sp.]|jgi:ECF transporter S component (folate family)|nr:folate family ECF transporter S component [Papillibacter sp.]